MTSQNGLDVVVDADGAPLIDVSGLSIVDLMTAGDPALARSLQRLISSVTDPNGVYSAFQSFAS
jgi:FXSXX-COOH protein